MFRFSGFELDDQRAELRTSGGAVVKIRLKTFEVLRYLATHPRRVVTKQELMEAVWRNVHVSDDSLFQCISELRLALGDSDRQIIKAIPGRGYLFEADVVDEEQPPHLPDPVAPASGSSAPAGPWRQRPLALAAAALLLVVMAIVGAGLLQPRSVRTSVLVAPIASFGETSVDQRLAGEVTDALIEGLAGIGTFDLVAPGAGVTSATYSIVSDLSREEGALTLKAQLVETRTGKVHVVATAATSPDLEPAMQRSRLVGGVGDQLARQLNLLMRPAAARESALPGSRIAVEQATASINQTSPERFRVAENMLEAALAADPRNLDVQVALAALRLRGLQIRWYDDSIRQAKEDSARTLLAGALEADPNSLLALEAQCRLLSTTTAYAESLVTCAQALSLDPWNGTALYLVGLGQLYLGRFEDALATFTLADRYDTPPVSRWTWLLGAGWANLLLGRPADALPWLERSIAITPASGRSYMMLAVAYDGVGRHEDARLAMQRGLPLVPGVTTATVSPPTENASAAFTEATEAIVADMHRLGLPAE